MVMGGVNRQFFSPLLPIKRNLAQELINEEGAGLEKEAEPVEPEEAESAKKGAESPGNDIHDLLETIQKLQTCNNELINKLEVRQLMYINIHLYNNNSVHVHVLGMYMYICILTSAPAPPVVQ